MSQTIGKCGNDGCNLENCEIHTTGRCKRACHQGPRQFNHARVLQITCRQGLQFDGERSYCKKCQEYFNLTELELNRLRHINSVKGIPVKIDDSKRVDPNTVFENFRNLISVIGKGDFVTFSRAPEWNFEWASEFCDEEQDWEHLTNICIIDHYDVTTNSNLYMVNSNKKLQDKLNWKQLTENALHLVKNVHEFDGNCFTNSLIVKFPELPWVKTSVTEFLLSRHHYMGGNGKEKSCETCTNWVLIPEIRHLIDFDLFAVGNTSISKELSEFIQDNPHYKWNFNKLYLWFPVEFIKKHSDNFNTWHSLTQKFMVNDVDYIINHPKLSWNFDWLTSNIDLEMILNNPTFPWVTSHLPERCTRMNMGELRCLNKFVTRKILGDKVTSDPYILDKIEDFQHSK